MSSRGTILVIDDDHDMRVTLRSCLEGAGFSVCSAAHGLHALELLGMIPEPRAILLDMVMPLMSGERFLEAFFSDTRLRSIPLIQMSAAPVKKHPEAFLFLPKPFDIQDLIRAIPDAPRVA